MVDSIGYTAEDTTKAFADKISFSYLFDINSSSNIKLIKSQIEGNTANYLVKNSQLLNIDSDTDLTDNKFIRTFEQ